MALRSNPYAGLTLRAGLDRICQPSIPPPLIQLAGNDAHHATGVQLQDHEHLLMARYNLLGSDMQIVSEISSEEPINHLWFEYVDGLRVVGVVPVEVTPDHVIPHQTGLESIDGGNDS